jgi:hypothetical protein
MDNLCNCKPGCTYIWVETYAHPNRWCRPYCPNYCHMGWDKDPKAEYKPCSQKNKLKSDN